MDSSVINVFTMGTWDALIRESLARWKISFLGSIPDDRDGVGTECEEGLSNPKAESCRRPRSEAPFFAESHKAFHNLQWSSDLRGSRKELYHELVVGTASDLLGERLGWSLDEIRPQWNRVPGLDFLNNSEFSVTWWLARNA